MAAELVDALCEYGGYQATLPDAEGAIIPNPVTKANFAKDVAKNQIAQIFKHWKSNQAATAARQTAEEAAITSLNITIA